MHVPHPTLSLSFKASLADISPADWDACTGADNPFVSYRFLSALEESGAVSDHSGWLPYHAVLRDSAGRVLAVAPAYLKAHSFGEYVFDQGWAQAFEQAGGRYYPKLLVAVPFSPVPGPRLMVRPASGISPAALAQGLIGAVERLRLSSAHVTFCTEAEAQALATSGWLLRLSMQFHWHNRGHRDFADFLDGLSSRKRKAIRKERIAAAAGLTLSTLRGADITERHWDHFFAFYRATAARKWGSAYLPRSFFSLLGERFGERVVLMWAEKDGESVAGALNLIGGDTLYGRNWGCRGEWPFLHFELCYYRAIEFAIAAGLRCIEAGAQGPHKIQRGYLPAPTYSAHWIADPGFRGAVADFLTEERTDIRAEMAELMAFSPYRQA